MTDTFPHDTSGGAASAITVRGRSGSTVGPSGSHYNIGPMQKANGPRKKEKTAMSHFWDMHHSWPRSGMLPCQGSSESSIAKQVIWGEGCCLTTPCNNRDLRHVKCGSTAWVGDTFHATLSLGPTFPSHISLRRPFDPRQKPVPTEVTAAT